MKKPAIFSILAAMGGLSLLASCTPTQKGTAIGAGGGAAAGAIIAKDGNEGRGALIGAGVGALGGNIIGRQKEQDDRISNLEEDHYRR